MELTPKHRKLYDAMRDELIAKIDGGMILAPNPLTNTIRLRQLACAFLEQVGEDEYQLVEPSPKLDELEELLTGELIDEPVVVFAEFRDLIKLAAARLEKRGITYSVLVGGQTEAEADFEYQRWQDGHTRVLLMTIATGAESFTFTRSAFTIYLQRPYSRLMNDQTEGRTHRIGQTRDVTYIDIVTADTIEDRVFQVLKEKDERFEEVVRDRNRLKELL